MVELISLHVPKCAGSSLALALRQVYGNDTVFIKSDELANPVSAFNIDPDGFMEKAQTEDLSYLSGKRVVHGHFYVGRFNRLKDAARATILRDPVDRLVSHYYFWKYHPSPMGPLRQYMLDRHLNVLEFARIPNMRYFYTRIFFRNIDMGMFDHIGDYRNMGRSADAIGALIGKPLVIPHHNKNPYRQYEQGRAELMADAARMATLRDLLRDDLEFYERWST